jgi:hypothetical protein
VNKLRRYEELVDERAASPVHERLNRVYEAQQLKLEMMRERQEHQVRAIDPPIPIRSLPDMRHRASSMEPPPSGRASHGFSAEDIPLLSTTTTSLTSPPSYPPRNTRRRWS